MRTLHRILSPVEVFHCERGVGSHAILRNKISQHNNLTTTAMHKHVSEHSSQNQQRRELFREQGGLTLQRATKRKNRKV